MCDGAFFTPMKRIFVIIDGSNFYHKIKSITPEIADTTHFNYRGLCEKLTFGGSIVSINYYIGIVHAKRNDLRGQQLRKNQNRLFYHLKSPKQNINVIGGYLMRNGNSFHEKGVDVNMAVDLLIGAFKDTYDLAILISSDSDLIPAIKEVRKLGKEIEFVGFQVSPSLGLIKYATKTTLLSTEDLTAFASVDISHS